MTNLNGYPEIFFDRIVRSFLNKIFEKPSSTAEPIKPKRIVLFTLPFSGLHSVQIRNQINKLYFLAYPHIQIRCIFRTVLRLSAFFRFKDSIPLKAQYHLLSDVILRLCNNIVTMYFDRYLSCFGIKIQIILANLYKWKIEY